MIDNIRNYINRIKKHSGLSFIIICFIIAFIVFIFAAWVSTFTYEPGANVSHYYKPIYIFLILFIPIASISIGLANFIKIIIDLIYKKTGSLFRLFIILTFMSIVIIPSFIITNISISVIKYNTNAWTKANVDGGLDLLLQSFEDRLSLKRAYMDNSITKASYDGVFAQIALKKGTNYTANMMLNNRGITNFYVIDKELTNIIFKTGIEPVINIDTLTNTNTVYIESQYDNSFYISAIIPIIRKKEPIAYSIWTEEMGSDFVEERNNSLNILSLYRSINLFSDEFDTLLALLYIFVMGVATFIMIILGSVLSRLILEPIINVSEMAQTLSSSNFNVRVKPRGLPEMRVLMSRFNIMAQSLKHHIEMQEHTQKLTAWRDVALKLAHEIKNPLTPIMINTDFIGHLISKTDIENKEKINESINIIMKNIKNIESLVNNFSQFSFETTFSDEKISINDCLRESISSFEYFKNVDFSVTYASVDYLIKMDRKKIIIAFNNIIKNAIEAIEPKGSGSIYLSTYHDKIEYIEYFIISITDTGIGIKKNIRSSIFEPYYTSKEKGTGLGLSLVEKIIQDHGGFVEIESVEDEGTTFFLKFQLNL